VSITEEPFGHKTPSAISSQYPSPELLPEQDAFDATGPRRALLEEEFEYQIDDAALYGLTIHSAGGDETVATASYYGMYGNYGFYGGLFYGQSPNMPVNVPPTLNVLATPDDDKIYGFYSYFYGAIEPSPLLEEGLPSALSAVEMLVAPEANLYGAMYGTRCTPLSLPAKPCV
jgi:hypothetical protein